jgi:hypothetical protein
MADRAIDMGGVQVLQSQRARNYLSICWERKMNMLRYTGYTAILAGSLCLSATSLYHRKIPIRRISIPVPLIALTGAAVDLYYAGWAINRSNSMAAMLRQTTKE